MAKMIYGVYGIGGYGREVMPLAKQEILRTGGSLKSLYFIDDKGIVSEKNGYPVLTFDEFLKIPAECKRVAIAIASSDVRQKISKKLADNNIQPWDLKDETVISLDDVTIGEGAILSPFVVLTSNLRIGRFFQANIYSYVAHDCVIGDFVTFAPGVRCNGNVIIEDHAYIGTGAMLRQGTPEKPLIIGKNAVVGMGAVVTRDVPPNTTVVGNPARPLVKTA